MEMESEVSLIIKTFERQDALERLLDSIIEHGFEECPVLIADDSKDPYREEIMGKYGSLINDYVVLPFDSGLSRGRNALLHRVKTKYFVLHDDDFVYDVRTDLPWMRARLKEYSLDLLGGVVYEENKWSPHRILEQFPHNTFGALRTELKTLYQYAVKNKTEKVIRFYGTIDVDDATVSLERTSYAAPITPCDYTLNFFMADTETVRKKVGGWHEDLKVSEHWEFFYRAKANNLRIAATEEVGVLHRPVHRPSYITQRFSREAECRRIGLETHNLKRLILQGYVAHDLSS